jgi:hypothetical protein
MGYVGLRILGVAMPSSTAFLPDTPDDLVDFFRSWDALPKHGLIPRLSDYFDAAPIELQPNVTIVDVHSPTRLTVRLFGTGLEDVSGIYPTDQDLMMLFAKPIQERAKRLVWVVVSHPVGYVCVRRCQTTQGLVYDVPAICLPIAAAGPGPYCFITYASVMDASQTMMLEENLAMVQDVKFRQWIDLGNGMPPVPPQALETGA